MKHFLFFALFLINLQVYAQADSASSSSYKRVYHQSTYFYLNAKGDTVIPPGKYRRLGNYDEKGMILAAGLNGKEGYINIHQDTLIPFIYDELNHFSYNLAMAKLNGQVGYLNRKGEIHIPFDFHLGLPFKSPGVAVVEQGRQRRLIDTNGFLIIKTQYSRLRYEEAHHLAILITDSLYPHKECYAFYFLDQNRLSPCEYQDIFLSYAEIPFKRNPNCVNCTRKTYFNKGLALVKKDYEFALLNKNLEPVVPYGRYDSIAPMNYAGLSIVKKSKKFGLIDSLGKEILEPKYDEIDNSARHSYEDQCAYFKVKENGKIRLLDAFGKTLFPVAFDSVEVLSWCEIIYHSPNGVLLLDGNLDIRFDQFSSYSEAWRGYIVSRYNKMGYLDEEGRLGVPIIYDSLIWPRLEKYLYAKQGENWGIIDLQGKVIIPMEYQLITDSYHDEKNFIVAKNGKVGTINWQNEIQIPIEYDGLSSWVEYGPSEHYALKAGKIGLIKTNGEILIPCAYDWLHYYTDSGLILVERNGQKGIIDRNQKILLPIIFDEIIVDDNYLNFIDKKDERLLGLKNGSWSYFDLQGNVLREKVPLKEIQAEYDWQLDILSQPTNRELELSLLFVMALQTP